MMFSHVKPLLIEKSIPVWELARPRYQVPERPARDSIAKVSMVSQRFSRSDFNCSALAWTASRLTELRDTLTPAPSPEERPCTGGRRRLELARNGVM